MNIRLHKQIGVNTKLFLDTMGYKSVWNKQDDNFDELVVLPPENGLLQAIVKEITKSGHIPYHYGLGFEGAGEYVDGEANPETGITKIEFKGEVKEVKTYENISGDFHLIRYRSEDGNNFINKRYKLENDILIGEVQVNCRLVARLTGIKGEKIHLVNWAKAKQL